MGGERTKLSCHNDLAKAIDYILKRWDTWAVPHSRQIAAQHHEAVSIRDGERASPIIRSIASTTCSPGNGVPRQLNPRPPVGPHAAVRPRLRTVESLQGNWPRYSPTPCPRSVEVLLLVNCAQSKMQRLSPCVEARLELCFEGSRR